MTKYGDMNESLVVTARRTAKDIEATFRKWGIQEYRVPPPTVDDAGRVIYWKNDDRQEVTCSRFPDYPRNIRAVYGLLEALRLADQRGMLPELARAAVALLPGGRIKKPAHEVLNIGHDAPLEVAEAAYKALARSRHPDAGGTDAAMKELNEAIEEWRTKPNGAKP